VSGCANPCGGEGRVGNRPLGARGRNRPWGALAAGTAALGWELVWKVLGFIEVCVWSWGTQKRAHQLPRTGDRIRGGPAQRETAKAEVHGGAAVPRARRGAKLCPTPTQAERPRRLSDQLRSQNGLTCLGPSGIWAEPLLLVAGLRGGLSGLGRIQEGFP